MTTTQTIDGVPRELLESLLTLAAMSASAPYRELRALLDSGECCHEFVPFQANCTKCGIPYKPAAQPQVEPTGWMFKRKDQSEFGKPSQHIAFASPDLEECRTGKNVEGRTVLTPRDDYFDWKPLYAEPPAPVAVVLPERLDLPHRDEFESTDQYAAAVGEAKKWNACLDEVTRLNSKS